ncbi:hypothetical protein LK459_07525 [Gordonia otitidis]|uniref:hypothetical protein n=1 Tax=Gordonia otitidis TaxID=249058 RepID=UPI001D155328|nr:hypothetical protein [Gordonia otitidis]UEA60672.1 hypothetical protein LK459_07525 [Gordonia otitidis]
MNTNKIKTATVALAGAAAIAGLGAIGAGTAAADVQPGNYDAEVHAVLGLAPIPLGHVPASIHGDVITIGGQSGHLTPTADGARGSIAGVPVVVESMGDADPGAYTVHVGPVANAIYLRHR